jgi:hypothetical protein
VTEAEWLKSTEPQAMLQHFRGKKKVLTERKQRLFAVACSRRVWELMPHVGRDLRLRSAGKRICPHAPPQDG